MALFFTSSQPSSLLSQNPKTVSNFFCHKKTNSNLALPFSPKNARKLLSFRIHSSSFTNENNEQNPSPISKPSEIENTPGKVVDEWGEKTEPEPDSSYTRFSDSDPPKNEDEWGGVEGGNDMEYNLPNNGTAATGNDDKIGDLKRCLVDTFYGTELGFKASGEVRAEVLELVNQLEALNPTPAPTEASSLLDGNWVLL